MRWPSSVSCACGRSRRNRSPPSSPSSCLMARVSEGCETLHFSAALVKFSSLTAARKYRTWCISIAATYRPVSQSAFPRLALPLAISLLATRQTRSPEGNPQAMTIAIKQPITSNGQTLIGKVSLVTGSTSGIGLGIARALAAAGSRIVLNGFGKADEIARLQAELAAEFNVDVSYSGADMSKPASIREMIEQTLDTAGRLDVLVNNAGIQHVAPLQDFPPEKWDAILAINLSSAFHTTRLALPSMLLNKWGRIINVASAHGLVASPFKSAYVAAKHGIVGLTKVVA